jgi:hypothetical protein
VKERQDIDLILNQALTLLKEKIDETMIYLEQHPEDTDYAAKAWAGAVRDFMNYGIKRSETKNGENLFRKVSRIFLFGR